MIDLKQYRKNKKLRVMDMGLDRRTVHAIENGGDVMMTSYMKYLEKVGLQIIIGDAIGFPYTELSKYGNPRP